MLFSYTVLGRMFGSCFRALAVILVSDLFCCCCCCLFVCLFVCFGGGGGTEGGKVHAGCQQVNLRQDESNQTYLWPPEMSGSSES